MSVIRHIYYDWTIQAEKIHYNNLKCCVIKLGWLTRDPKHPHLKYRVETLHSSFVLSKRLQAFIQQKNCGFRVPPMEFASQPLIRFCFKQYPQTIKEPYVFETD
jgi:hypothetical protein